MNAQSASGDHLRADAMEASGDMGFDPDTVDLRHLPPRGMCLGRKVYFRILMPFCYTSPHGVRTEIPAHDTSAQSPYDSATDLASVPSPLWGLIASYGRQTQPALLHDHMCIEARKQSDRRAGAKCRRKADWLFWQALRDQRIGPVERSLMWAAVRFQGMLEFEIRWLVAYAMVVLAGVLSVWTWLDLTLRWVSSWNPPVRRWLESVWPSDAGLPIGWPRALPALVLAVLVLLLWILRRRDIAGAGLITAPGVYVAVPVAAVNIAGLVMLWLASMIVYAPVAASRWVLGRLSWLVGDRWKWLRQLWEVLNREKRPEIGPTNSL